MNYLFFLVPIAFMVYVLLGWETSLIVTNLLSPDDDSLLGSWPGGFLFIIVCWPVLLILAATVLLIGMIITYIVEIVRIAIYGVREVFEKKE